jgi:Zn-dependent M28 family amino/carboxypeptidase
VLIGNHRDAWVFGALDPSSGTAVMMEMSRVMGQLVKSGEDTTDGLCFYLTPIFNFQNVTVAFNFNVFKNRFLFKPKCINFTNKFKLHF